MDQSPVVEIHKAATVTEQQTNAGSMPIKTSPEARSVSTEMVLGRDGSEQIK